MPGATVSGFVLTNLDEGVKVVDVDLITQGDARSFTFVAVDPSFKATSLRVDFDELYTSDELIHVDDEDELRPLLERLPCCVTNADGTENGDPLNLVLVGNRADFLAAFVRRQWHPTEVIWSGSLWRTVRSFVQGSRYRYSPISSLYLYGRPQDLATQKARASIHERNHARFWLSPIRFRGKEVYVGQISRDIGVKYTLEVSDHLDSRDRSRHRRVAPLSGRGSPVLAGAAQDRLRQGRRGVQQGRAAAEPDGRSVLHRRLARGDVLRAETLLAESAGGPRLGAESRAPVTRTRGTPMTGARAAGGLALLLLAGACASAFERPAPFVDAPLRARAVSKTDDGIRVSAAVPSASESRSIFGVDLEAARHSAALAGDRERQRAALLLPVDRAGPGVLRAPGSGLPVRGRGRCGAGRAPPEP